MLFAYFLFVSIVLCFVSSQELQLHFFIHSLVFMQWLTICTFDTSPMSSLCVYNVSIAFILSKIEAT